MEITLYVVSKIRKTSTLEPVKPYIHRICSVETNIEDVSLRHIEHWRKGNIFVQKGLPWAFYILTIGFNLGSSTVHCNV